jgi:hypothetical protein
VTHDLGLKFLSKEKCATKIFLVTTGQIFCLKLNVKIAQVLAIFWKFLAILSFSFFISE